MERGRGEEKKEREWWSDAEGRGTRWEEEARRNGIVTSGMKWSMKELETEVEAMLEEKLKLRIRVRGARRILYRNGEQGVVAKSGTWEKKEVTRRKKELEEGVFIDDDLKRKKERRGRDGGG